MNFYYEWLNKKNTPYEKDFFTAFLSCHDKSVEAWACGDDRVLAVAISVVCSSPIEKYVEIIDSMDLSTDVLPAQVPQFSDFIDGTTRVIELLEFEPEGVTFEELGYQLVKSSEGAAVKYGENHAKLAKTMGLVEISKRPSNVRSSRLGHYMLKLNEAERTEVMRRMVLRNYSIQKILKESKDKKVSYERIMANLSPKTATRRRNNVKCLLEFALKDTACFDRLANIDWQVNL